MFSKIYISYVHLHAHTHTHTDIHTRAYLKHKAYKHKCMYLMTALCRSADWLSVAIHGSVPWPLLHVLGCSKCLGLKGQPVVTHYQANMVTPSIVCIVNLLVSGAMGAMNIGDDYKVITSFIMELQWNHPPHGRKNPGAPAIYFVRDSWTPSIIVVWLKNRRYVIVRRGGLCGDEVEGDVQQPLWAECLLPGG